MPAPAPPPPAAPTRRLRWAGGLAALALVLWGHALLLQALRPPPRAGLGAAAATPVLVRTLARPVVAEAGAGDAAAGPGAPPAAAPAPTAPVPGALPQGPPSAPRVEAAALAAPPAEAAARGAAGGVAGGATGAAAASVGAAAGVDEAAAGEPPPVYPTRLPPPARLRYQLRYHGQTGEAWLVWWHDGQRYRLALDGRSATGAPLIEQLSQGGLDGAGLAPERFVDRRRGRGWQAANVERAVPAGAAADPPAAPAPASAPGRVRFSGPSREHPAWPGLQDRLSWVAQFAAVLAAAPEPPPAELRLFVVDARGEGGLWVFADQGEAAQATPLGPAAVRHWRRDPPRPEGLRVDAWTDARRGHWPLRLRFTVGRSGEVFELTLAEEPAPAGPAPAAGP